MHCIKTNFDKVLQLLRKVLGDAVPLCGNLTRPGPRPKFTDLEVIALSFTAECMSIDSESLLFSLLNTTYKDKFPTLISRRQYNDRRKGLFQWKEQIRVMISSQLNEVVNMFVIDSMPLEICKMARKDRNKMGKENEYSCPDKGFCASQNKWFYGYRLHCTCSPSGVVQSLDLSKASAHDILYLKDVSHLFKNCTIIGDKGYLGKAIKEELQTEQKITLLTPPRSNQKDMPQMPYILKRVRKRIETVFSQLCDQFMIQRNYAKSFSGFRTRILSKISGLTILQYINKVIKNQPIGRVKYALK